VKWKNISLTGVRSVSITIEADVDEDAADNEVNAIVYGTQNERGTAEVELGDLKDISANLSVGSAATSLRCTGKAKYVTTQTDLTIIMATAYIQSINYNIPHGDEATARVTFRFNVAGLSYA